jgi:hypothetical protein
MIIGAWRSLVAHLHGVQGVGGSNPLAPILNCRLVGAAHGRDKSSLAMSPASLARLRFHLPIA